MAFTGSVYGNGVNSTSGENNKTFFYDRAGIKASTDDLIYGKFVDAKSIPQKTGKTFKISRFRHILDDANTNNQGLDGAGNPIGAYNAIFDNTLYTHATALSTAVTAATTGAASYVTNNPTWKAKVLAIAKQTSVNAVAGGATLVTPTAVVFKEGFTADIADANVEILITTGEAAMSNGQVGGNNIVVDLSAGILITDTASPYYDEWLRVEVPTVFTSITTWGNAYGGSRNVGDVASGMPSLAEGADKVNRVGVTKETFETTLNRYGNYIEYTDEVDMFSEDSIQVEYREKLGRMAAEVFDDATQLGMLGAAGVSVFPGTVTNMKQLDNTDATHRINDNLIRKVVKQLKINRAEKNTSMLTGSVKVGTTPINAAYYALIGPDVAYDLDGLSTFKPVHEYGYAQNLAMNEIGSLREARFIETNRAMKYEGMGASGGDVYPILFPTKGSYANVGLQGKGKISFKAKAPGTPTSEDPYGVKGLFSYNFWYAGIALQPEKLAVAYVAAS